MVVDSGYAIRFLYGGNLEGFEMNQREEVLELRYQWEHNEISSCEIWAYCNSGYISRGEALWILR